VRVGEAAANFLDAKVPISERQHVDAPHQVLNVRMNRRQILDLMNAVN